jgi:hypothetical protein
LYIEGAGGHDPFSEKDRKVIQRAQVFVSTMSPLIPLKQSQ